LYISRYIFHINTVVINIRRDGLILKLFHIAYSVYVRDSVLESEVYQKVSNRPSIFII